ncbi:MAG: hypothetical protein M3Y25_04065, partial [Thermoproteota archaeon]|nr:hypothetical protein [Thermoproteota archaeon]
MKSSKFYCKVIIIIIATGLVTSLLSTSNFEDNLTFVTLSFGQLLQHNPEELQSTINKQLRQTVTDTIND